MTPDMRALFEKRIYDIAAITDKSVKVKYNGALIPVKHFQQYIDLYIGAKGETKRIYEAPDPRWEYVVSLAPNGDPLCSVVVDTANGPARLRRPAVTVVAPVKLLTPVRVSVPLPDLISEPVPEIEPPKLPAVP